jgi:hypothetical protein
MQAGTVDKGRIQIRTLRDSAGSASRAAFTLHHGDLRRLRAACRGLDEIAVRVMVLCAMLRIMPKRHRRTVALWRKIANIPI